LYTVWVRCTRFCTKTKGFIFLIPLSFFPRFLDRIQDHTVFILLSFILRILEALGGAAVCTASFTIIALEFPNSIATTFVMKIFYSYYYYYEILI